MQTHESYDYDGIFRMLVVHGCIQPLTSVEGAIRLFIRNTRVKVSPHAHLCRQLTHYTQTLNREWVPETRSLEPGIASKMSLATLVEWPSQVCTHRPSHCISSRSSEVVTRCPSWKVGMDCENTCWPCLNAVLTPFWGVSKKTNFSTIFTTPLRKVFKTFPKLWVDFGLTLG